MSGQLRVLSAGRLCLQAGGEPWSCRFSDAVTGSALCEPAVRPGTPVGSFGFQTRDSGRRVWLGGPAQERPGPENADSPPATHWRHATGLVDSQSGDEAFLAVLSTDDPGGRRIEVEATPAGEGVISVGVSIEGTTRDVVAVGHSFVASADESFFGFGERSDVSCRKSGVVECYVGEGPWQEHEYPFLQGVVPPWGVRQRRDATYFPVPWALTSRGFGVLVRNDETTWFRLRSESEDVWGLEVEARELRYQVFAGPHPLDALRRFTEATGRQPTPGARWWFGPWYQTGHANHVPHETEREQLDLLRQARAPVSAAETHCRFLPVGAHRGHEADERLRASWFHAQGLATLSYLNPMVADEYSEVFSLAQSSGALQSRPDGSPYVFTGYAGDRDPPVAQEAHFDLTTEEGRSAWGVAAGDLVTCGHDGWMEDFGEYTPLDATGRSGSSGPALHNRYPLEYHRGAAAVTAELEAETGRPLARFVRSGWTGSSRWSPVVWGGDPTCGWGFDGLASALTEGLSMGASGVAMWGSDIGGFVSSVDRLTPELLRRWIQFGSCCPVMRTKSSGIEQPSYRRPQVWDPEIVETWTRWAAWHTQLNDYLQAAHAEYRTSGIPIMRAMGLVWPDETEARDCEDQFLLGGDLLVAPVLSPGAFERSVWIPPGEWTELWKVARYRASDRGIEIVGRTAGRSEAVLRGPRRTTVSVKDDEIPLFVRAGAVLQLLSNEVDTLSAYGDAACGVVRAFERNGQRSLLAFPAGDSQSLVSPGMFVTSTVGEDGWRLTIDGGAERTYRIQAWLGLLEDGGFVPHSVSVGATTLDPARWSFAPSTGVLDLEVRMSGGTLDVVGVRR